MNLSGIIIAHSVENVQRILVTFRKSVYTDIDRCRPTQGAESDSGQMMRRQAGKDGRKMDFLEKLGETITTKGKEAADKAKDMAEIASLKSQIATCEEVIKKNYTEIGRLFMEQYQDAEDAPFEKQRTAIRNAQAGVEELQKKIRRIKGL